MVHPEKVILVQLRSIRLQDAHPVSTIIRIVKYSFRNHYEVIRTREVHEEKKADEMSVVEVADAVINPGTMVI